MKTSPRHRALPRKKKHFCLPVAILAFSLLTGSLTGKFVLPDTGRWLPLTLPVFSLAALSAPSPIALAAAGITGGILLEIPRCRAQEGGKGLPGREFTLEGKVVRTSPQRFGRVETDFFARDILWLERSPLRKNMVIVVPEEDAPFPGNRVRIRVAVDEGLPGERRPWGRAVKGSVKIDPPLISLGQRGGERLSDVLDRSPHQTAGLLGAISLGQRWRVENSIRTLFNRTGVYHLLAISGVHLVSAIFPVVLMVRLWTAWFELDRAGFRSLLIPFFGTGILGIYFSLAGLSTSAIRAATFLVLVWSCGIFKRARDPLSILGWCVIFIACVSTRHQPDAALLLSAGAVLGILSTLDQKRGLFGKALAASLGAMLFTLPMSVWFSRGIPITSPVCNVTAGFFFGVVLIPFAILGVLAACVTPLPMEPIVGAWCSLAQPVIKLLDRVSSLEYSFLILSQGGCLAATVCGCVALVIWKKRQFSLFSGLVLFLGIALFCGVAQQAMNVFLTGRTLVCFPRAGQADAAILRSAGCTILIDAAGPPSPGRQSPVEVALSKMGVKKIDAVFLTHSHPDHIGGFRDIQKRWKIGTLYLPEREKEPGKWSSLAGCLPPETRIVYLSLGDTVRVGEFSFIVHGPAPGWAEEKGENTKSLLLNVRGGGLSAIFTGDASWDQALEALGPMDDLNLLKIPHHGSKDGFPPPGLEKTVLRLRKEGVFLAVFPSPPPRAGSALPAVNVVNWFETRGIPCLFSGAGKGIFLKVRQERRVQTSSPIANPEPVRVPLVDIPCPF